MIINHIKYTKNSVEVRLPTIITIYSETDNKNNVVYLQKIIHNPNQSTKNIFTIDISKTPTYQLPVRP